MFGKLLKHNFLDTWKEFCSLYGVIIVLGVLLGAAASTGYGALFTIISILFGGSFVAIVVLYIIYFFRISNTSVYGKQGYLTHSIPVSAHELILSKILTLFIYMLGFAISLSLSFLLITIIISPEVASELVRGISLKFDVLLRNPLSAFLYFLYSLVDVLAGLVLIQFIFAAANTGITRNKRLLIAIVIYIGIGIVLSIFEEVLDPIQIQIALDADYQLVAINLRTIQPDQISDLSASLFSVWSFILAFIEMICLYFLTIYILNKRIEIE